MGGKYKIAKSLVAIFSQSEYDTYIEPFAGGMNVIDKVKGKRIANDINLYTIALFDSVSNHEWIPPEDITKEQYDYVMNNYKELPPNLVGYVLSGCSFGGKWRGSYAHPNGKRHYGNEARRAILKQGLLLAGTEFVSKDYKDLEIGKGNLVYCDPPYADTTEYGIEKGFDHKEFWDWVRFASLNNIVYVSELTAPDDFEVVWQKEINHTLDKKSNKRKTIEKLFRCKK
jgi:DNA adenine methylase